MIATVFVIFQLLSAAYDLWIFRIPNVLPLALVLLFFSAAVPNAAAVDWASQLGAGTLVFVAGAVLFRFRLMGGRRRQAVFGDGTMGRSSDAAALSCINGPFRRVARAHPQVPCAERSRCAFAAAVYGPSVGSAVSRRWPRNTLWRRDRRFRPCTSAQPAPRLAFILKWFGSAV